MVDKEKLQKELDASGKKAPRKEEYNPLDSWKPKTELGKKVKRGKIKTIEEVMGQGKKILESEIIDVVMPEMESDLLSIGQSKGKFGGGKKSIWKQTQKKTKEGNKPKFATLSVIGNKEGYFGMGHGKSKETMPAREKAVRQAKLSLIKIKRGCGSWDCSCETEHSLPFKVTGKSGAVEVSILPAPKGTGLKAEQGIQKILELAGITDAYAKTTYRRTKLNLMFATFDALKKLSQFK